MFISEPASHPDYVLWQNGRYYNTNEAIVWYMQQDCVFHYGKVPTILQDTPKALDSATQPRTEELSEFKVFKEIHAHSFRDGIAQYSSPDTIIYKGGCLKKSKHTHTDNVSSSCKEQHKSEQCSAPNPNQQADQATQPTGDEIVAAPSPITLTKAHTGAEPGTQEPAPVPALGPLPAVDHCAPMQASLDPIAIPWLKYGQWVKSTPTLPPLPATYGPPTRKQVMTALSAAVQGPCAFSFSNWIMMDTGCPNDLTRKALAYKFPYFIHKIQPVIFNTANDAVECSEACSAHLSPLDNDPCDFHLVDESPTVCTVGGRCANRGFWFIWIPYKTPVMITPAMKIVSLDVINDVP